MVLLRLTKAALGKQQGRQGQNKELHSKYKSRLVSYESEPKEYLYLIDMTASSSSESRKGARTTATTNNNDDLNDSHSDILFYAGAILAVLIAVKAVLQALTSSLIVLPLLYFYLLSSCPPLASFHAKQELKRVLRGHHLPEQHPNKPTGFWEQTIARVTASVTTELATTVAGYEVTSVSLAGGAAWFQTVKLGQQEFYWIGAAQRWWYLFSRELSSSSTNSSKKK